MSPTAPQLPPFTSLDELVEFFDSRDMGDYEEALLETHFEVDLRRKIHLVADLNRLAKVVINAGLVNWLITKRS